MIPHALECLAPPSVLVTVLFGIILFYVLEKMALWRHCHEHPCEVHSRAGSVSLGIATAVAVIAHEVPQEVGDFAILLESGYSRTRALIWNGLSSLAALPGALLTYFLLPVIQQLVPFLLSVAAASFIYIALADLVPGRRDTGGPHR